MLIASFLASAFNLFFLIAPLPTDMTPSMGLKLGEYAALKIHRMSSSLNLALTSLDL